MDIVQDTFLKIHEMGAKVTEINNMEAWSVRVTKNLAMDQLRSYRNKNGESLNGFDQASVNPTPHRSLESSDIRKSIEEIVTKLPPAQIQVFQLRDVEGYSYEEISEALEMSLSQVKTNLFRARQKIRTEFKRKEQYGL